MVKSNLQKFINILSSNTILQDLLVEFDIDFDSVARTLVDDVLFKFDDLIQANTVYNLAEDPNEIIGNTEVTTITCIGDVGHSLNGSYFNLSTPTTDYYIWFNTGAGVDPSPVGRIAIEVAISSNDPANTVAAAMQSAVDAITGLSATVSDEVVIITNDSDGEADDASDGSIPTGFTIEITEQGLDPTLSIAALNEEISTVLGLYPGSIAAPHKDNYRTYTSLEGTLYIYLLKWLYYCYKFFNEEQFFFHNLLNSYVPNYDNEIISSTTNLKIYFDGLGILLDTIDQKITDLNTLSNIDEIDENLLKYMAHLLGYQKEDFSIENISFRELIKNLTEIYKRKGTEYSFQLFFKLLGFDAEVREYYWDRDAQNPEGFAAIDSTNILYYLTTQNPRTRHRDQLSDMSNSGAQQPIDPKLWTESKDLRYFDDLQSTYSLSEILGFKKSEIADVDKFTYFKSNYINFRLTQFYTKQDLTAKDTDTILKYVKFLTPIYVSAFIDVVTTPWEEEFENYNTEAAKVTLEGDPGNPNWVDILLPFIFVTLRDYIPLNLMPASDDAVIVAINGTQDLDSNGTSDSAMPVVFGNPTHGINITGSIDLSTPSDLTNSNLINLKIDEGRGTKITVNGTDAQTFEDLVDAINIQFVANSIDATATIYPDPTLFPPLQTYTVRVYSNTLSMSSKVYMVNGIVDDLFISLSVSPLAPIDGNFSTKGYQDFATFTDPTDSTGLTLAHNYNFYMNLDDTDFSEVDVSGETISSTTGQQIIDAINNHYDLTVNTNFAISTTCQYLDSSRLTNDKIVIVYRDVSSGAGRIIIMNPNGTIHKSGINFSLVDVNLVTVVPSINDAIKKFFVAYRETATNNVKWLIFNYDGDKLTTSNTFETGAGEGSSLTDIQSITLTNNRVVIIYDRSSDSYMRIFDLNGEVEVGTGYQWQTSSLTQFDVTTLSDDLVISAVGGSGGVLVYMKNDGTYLFGNMTNSTKGFDVSTTIVETNLVETSANEIYLAWRDTNDNKGYHEIWDASGNEIVSSSVFVEDIDILTAIEAVNENIILSYHKITDDAVNCQFRKTNGTLAKKEILLYDDTAVTEISLEILSTSDMIINLVVPNKGVFLNYDHLGDVASLTTNSYLRIESIEAGATWDDNVENYAETTDLGHKFTIDGTEYEFDNYSDYYRTFENKMFTRERNAFNTFFSITPNDDVIPIIEDTLNTIFTILISVTNNPVESVDRANFYIQRNGYISRAQEGEDLTRNGHMSKYTRHQDFSDALRTDSDRVKKEINWPSYNNENTTDDDWSTWSMAIDYFQPQVNFEEPYDAVGSVVISGAALTSLEKHLVSGTIIATGSSDVETEIIRSGYGSIYTTGITQPDDIEILLLAGYSYPGAEEESSIYDNGSNTINATIWGATDYNGIYVVGGENGRVASYDGTSWKKYDGSGSGIGPYNNSTAIGSNRIYPVIKYSNGISDFLIVGGYNSRVASYDGVNWKNYDGSGSGTGPYNPATLGSNIITVAIDYNNILIVAGYGGRVSSYDGTNWKYYDGSGTGTGPYSDGNATCGNDTITAITIYNNMIIFGTFTGQIFSYDSTNWKNSDGTGSGLGPYGQNILGTNERIWGIIQFNTLLIVAGPYNRISSYDGTNWRLYSGSGIGTGIYNSSTNLLGAGITIQAIEKYMNYLVFGSDNGRIASYDGANWKNYDGSGSGVGPFDDMTAIGNQPIYSLVTYEDDLIVAGGNGHIGMWGIFDD